MTTAKSAALKKTKPYPRSSTRTAISWKEMLMPILATVVVSAVANLGVGIWQSATFKAQVAQTMEHQKEQDTAIQVNNAALQALMTRLPIDYIPRVEQERNRELTKEMREAESKRLDAMEAKLDLIIENQHLRH